VDNRKVAYLKVLYDPLESIAGQRVIEGAERAILQVWLNKTSYYQTK
jgi:hypothetical protein